MKSNRGSSLLALIITIVILIILAGVSLAMLTGEHGLFLDKLKQEENKNVENNSTTQIQNEENNTNEVEENIEN